MNTGPRHVLLGFALGTMNTFPDTPWDCHIYLHYLGWLLGGQWVGIYASPMECLGFNKKTFKATIPQQEPSTHREHNKVINMHLIRKTTRFSTSGPWESMGRIPVSNLDSSVLACMSGLYSPCRSINTHRRRVDMQLDDLTLSGPPTKSEAGCFDRPVIPGVLGWLVRSPMIR